MLFFNRNLKVFHAIKTDDYRRAFFGVIQPARKQVNEMNNERFCHHAAYTFHLFVQELLCVQ